MFWVPWRWARRATLLPVSVSMYSDLGGRVLELVVEGRWGRTVDEEEVVEGDGWVIFVNWF